MSTNRATCEPTCDDRPSQRVRDLSLLYLLCEAGHPRSQSPLRVVVKPSFRSILHFIFTYVVGERPIYCEWDEYTTNFGLKCARYTPPTRTRGGVVLLYLHGSGSRGSSFHKMRLQSLPRIVQETVGFPYSVVCPLCPLKTEWSKPHMLTNLGKLLDEIQQESEHIFSEPTVSIVVTGPSMGGLGSYMVAAKFPEKIVATIPICGGGKKVFASLVAQKVPSWFFHGANDTCVSVFETDEIVNTIRGLVPNHLQDHWIRYSRYETCGAPWNIPWCEGHDSFSHCYVHEWEHVERWIHSLTWSKTGFLSSVGVDAHFI